jgi:hypothetical protein
MLEFFESRSGLQAGDIYGDAFRPEDWCSSGSGGDGLVAQFSQSHPRLPAERESGHVVWPRLGQGCGGLEERAPAEGSLASAEGSLASAFQPEQIRTLRPGVWNVVPLTNVDHLSVVPAAFQDPKFKHFFRDGLFKVLDRLPNPHSVVSAVQSNPVTS